MKTRHTSILLLLWALLFSVPLSAQKLTVESMIATNDQTANLSENLVKDLNGDYAGLVKVRLTADGAQFEGLVLKKKKHNASEYWVFMAKNSTKLTVIVPGILPLLVNFAEYGISGIESRCTYLLTLAVPQLMQAGPIDDGMRYLAMTVEPKNSVVKVDDVLHSVDANGEVSVYLPMGRHTYSVSAPGFATKEGSVELSDDTAPLRIELESTHATLRVECPTAGAQVVVGGKVLGTAPWSGSLAPGNYKVEASLDGYHPQQQSVTLAEKESRTLTFPSLQMITGRLNIDCRPIGSDVYVDGKKIGTSPGVFRDIQMGDHRVEIRKEGYVTMVKNVTIKENEQSSLTGSLDAVYTSSGNADDLRRRDDLLNCVERYRSYYDTKDIKSIEDIFSDDAIIVTGREIKKKSSEGSIVTSMINTKRSKSEYIKDLKVIFKERDSVRVYFNDINLNRHPTKKNIYMVTVHQKWQSPRYEDEGYKALLWQFPENGEPPRIIMTIYLPNRLVNNSTDVFNFDDFNIILDETSASSPHPTNGQEMRVEGMTLTTDQTANLSENMYKDNNGEYGGLVKVMLAAPDAKFEGWVLKQQPHGTGEYWIFMAKGSDSLSIKVPGYPPVVVNFRYYGIDGIQSKRTYRLDIMLP